MDDGLRPQYWLDRISAQASTMVEWFVRNYDDPAEWLPYESREGGYQWIVSPSIAEEELRDEFPQYDRDAINLAVTAIESTGTFEWVNRSDIENIGE